MKTKKEVPAGSEPAEDSNIINVGCVVERSKGNENIPFCKNNCKNNCNCLTTREKVLATLRNVHTIQEFIGLGSNGELRVRWDRAKIKKINSRIWKQ